MLTCDSRDCPQYTYIEHLYHVDKYSLVMWLRSPPIHLKAEGLYPENENLAQLISFVAFKFITKPGYPCSVSLPTGQKQIVF